MPIYVIVSPDQSDDYNVVACTTDIEAADRALKFAMGGSWDGDSARIHVYEDCKEAFIDMNIDKKNFYHVVTKGGIEDAKVTKFTRKKFEYCKRLMLNGPSLMKYGLDPIYSVDCCAEDEEHAKKIAFDVISKYSKS